MNHLPHCSDTGLAGTTRKSHRPALRADLQQFPFAGQWLPRSFPPGINEGTPQMVCESWGWGELDPCFYERGRKLRDQKLSLSALHLSPHVLRITSDLIRQRQYLGSRGGADV